jgi:uncharacterized protein involved in exopolysaccharide biosynthesis
MKALNSGKEVSDGGGLNIHWFVHALKKQRWLILAAFVIVPLVVAGAVMRLPDEYTSAAVFELIQQQVPRQYVDQMSNVSSSEMILGVTREVLSIPRLSGVVDAFGLFPKDRGQLTAEQLGEKLREQIQVMPVDRMGPRGDYTAFRISYTGENAKLAQQVLSQLSSLFIEVNLKERGSQAQTTTLFLKNQMEVARERMNKQEQVLIGIKMSNVSQNPAVSQAKIGAISDLRMQLQNATTSLNRLTQQRGSVETMLGTAIARLQNERTALLNTFTAKHPEILKKDREIANIQAIHTALRSNSPLPSTDTITDPMLGQLLTQIESNAAEMDRLTREAQTLREEISRYQTGLIQASSPVREHELERAQKDFETLKQEFADLQAKYFRSQMALNLEENQSGQNFRLIDPPSLPATPSGPKRMKISLGAIGGGLALGIVLALLLEIRKQTFLREADVRQTYQGVLVIAMPMLSTPPEIRWQRFRTAVECVTAVILVAAVGAVEYYIYLHG